MKDKEKIEKITNIIDDLNLRDMTSNELWRETNGKSFREIFDELWELYSAIGDIADILNAEEK